MTDTIDDVAAEAAGQEPVEPAFDEQSVAEQLVAQAREKGIELVGPDGLLSQLTKRVLETALEAEMTDHLSCACPGSTSIMLPPRTHRIIRLDWLSHHDLRPHTSRQLGPAPVMAHQSRHSRLPRPRRPAVTGP